MGETEKQIQGMIDQETRAWDARDAETLVSLFHPDMVWPWPGDKHAHDPLLIGFFHSADTIGIGGRINEYTLLY